MKTKTLFFVLTFAFAFATCDRKAEPANNITEPIKNKEQLPAVNQDSIEKFTSEDSVSLHAMFNLYFGKMGNSSLLEISQKGFPVGKLKVDINAVSSFIQNGYITSIIHNDNYSVYTIPFSSEICRDEMKDEWVKKQEELVKNVVNNISLKYGKPTKKNSLKNCLSKISGKDSRTNAYEWSTDIKTIAIEIQHTEYGLPYNHINLILKNKELFKDVQNKENLETKKSKDELIKGL